MQSLDDVIAIAEHEWRAMGIVPRDRAALSADLRGELTAAAADGVTPAQLLGDDIRAFAREVAAEAGVLRLPYEFQRILTTALAGAAPGLVLGWLLLWWIPTGYVGFAVAALAILVGVLVALRVRLRDLAAIGRTVWAMAVLLPIAGALVTPVTMGFAALTGYSTAAPVVLVECAIVAAALAGATVLARRWALAPALGSVRAAPATPPPR